jgi:hypothetical protein
MSDATLVGTVAQVVVIWMYASLATRLSPTLALIGALAAFVVTAAVTQILNPSIVLAAVLAGAGFVIALRWWPRAASGLPESGRYRLALRVALSAGFTVLIVTFAARMGPGLAGLAAALPVMSLIMALVTHQELGSDASSRFLKGVSRGSFSYVASMLVLSELLRARETGVAFLSAIGVALAIQLAVQSLDSFPGIKRVLSISTLSPTISLERWRSSRAG